MVLRAAAIGAAAGVVAGTATAQDEAITESEIELGGRVSAWVGQSPEAIADERNPTLVLVEGQEYNLTWENLDGEGHNFVIEDEEGEERFVGTEIVDGTGTTQDVEFTAEDGMAEYFCSPHPTSMRGDIEIVDDPDDVAEPDDVEEPDEFAAIVDELYDLTLEADGWRVTEPEELAEETNPTLELQAEGVYVLNWTNGLENGAVVEDDEAMDDENDEAVGDDEMDDEEEADDEMDDDGAASELVILAADEQERIRSDQIGPGESSAVVFVADEELEAYRDESTGAEGAIEVEPVDDEAEDNDENGVEDLFVDPPDDEDDEDDE